MPADALCEWNVSQKKPHKGSLPTCDCSVLGHAVHNATYASFPKVIVLATTLRHLGERTIHCRLREGRISEGFFDYFDVLFQICAFCLPREKKNLAT